MTIKIGTATYMSAEQAAKKLKTSVQQVRIYCRDSRIPGARKWNGVWIIPLNPVVLPTTKQQEKA